MFSLWLVFVVTQPMLHPVCSTSQSITLESRPTGMRQFDKWTVLMKTREREKNTLNLSRLVLTF